MTKKLKYAKINKIVDGGGYMQTIEEKKAYDDVVKKTCLVTNTAYLAAHIFYLLFFLITQTYVLVYINIGSIIVYSLFYLLIKLKKYLFFTDGCGIEIMAYMICATILCGFGPGFHLCIIGLCIIAFYAAYFSKSNRSNKKAVIWTIMSMFIFIGLYFICDNITPYYQLDHWAVVFLFVAHAFIVFMFICIYLRTFTNYATRLEDRIKRESRTDNLTQIPNRYGLYDYLNILENKENYVLAIFDIDDFKKINDKYGHICGDYVLKELARITKISIDDSFISRYGGEEFITILKKEDNMFDKVDLIRKQVEDHDFIFEDINIDVTITTGAADYINDLANDEWINIADSKLYEGKNSGKNKTVM